jgi:hypothetical protein
VPAPLSELDPTDEPEPAITEPVAERPLGEIREFYRPVAEIEALPEADVGLADLVPALDTDDASEDEAFEEELEEAI